MVVDDVIGLVLAGGGLALHQVTGSPVPDAIGSILVGALLGVVAIVLIEQNRRFLVGQEVDPAVRQAVIAALTADPEVSRVTYLRLEFVGPRMVSVIGDVDLTGDPEVPAVYLAVRRGCEARLNRSTYLQLAEHALAGGTLSVSSRGATFTLRPA